MDVIYSCALMPFMPLVPGVGNDAWAGLPGARPDTRSSIPHKKKTSMVLILLLLNAHFEPASHVRLGRLEPRRFKKKRCPQDC